MELFFKEIGDKIQHALKKEIQEIRNQIGDERIYSVAMVTDSDCITLFLAVNTYEYMEREDSDKWIPDEWGYSDGKKSEFVEISKLLFKKEEADWEEYEKYHDLFIETVIMAFKQVIDSGFFGENSEEITYFVSMSDDDEAEEIENNSAKILNSEKVYKEYLRRDEYWEQRMSTMFDDENE